MKTIMLYLLISIGSVFLLAPILSAFSLSNVEFDPQGSPTVTVPVVSSNYYVLLRMDLESDVETAVNLSGKTSAVKNLAAETDLDLESIFHISSSGDQGGNRAIWANELHGFTTAPRQVEIVSGTSAHGVSVIAAAPTLLDRIIAWLDTTL